MPHTRDNASPEVARANYGWFGEPWPSSICYLDNGELNTAMRLPVPAGETCLHCEETIDVVHSGKAMPCLAPDDGVIIRYVHKECLVVMMAGSLAHHDRRCRCFGGTDVGTEGMTARQEALAVWDLLAGAVR